MNLGKLQCGRPILTLALALSLVQPTWAAPVPSRAQLAQYAQFGQRFGLTAAQVAQVFSFIDANAAEINAAAAEKRVNQTAFRAIARELGLRNYFNADPQRLLAAIRAQATQAASFEAENAMLKRQVAALQDAALRTPVEAALARADAAYAAGDLETAQRELNSLLDLRQGELASSTGAYEAASKSAITLAQSRGDRSMVDRLVEASDAVLQRIADQATHARWENRMAQAATAYEQGDLKGDNQALLDAIALFRNKALPLAPRDRMPLDWAKTQVRLAIATGTLGGRESTTTHLDEAIAIYRLALEEYTRERAPFDWATTQAALGNDLWRLGTRENSSARLEEALQAYRLSLEVRTRDQGLYDWAVVQSNIGVVLATLGGREGGTARLEEAVIVFRLALDGYHRDSEPTDWARAQMNLANALRMIAERQGGTVRLKEAETAIRHALSEFKREREPLEWARAEMDLGTVLLRFGERESGTERLEEAVAAYKLSLEEFSRARVPLEWGGVQLSLGAALATLGERETGTARLKEAIAAYRLALEELRRDRMPLDWAMAQTNLGATLTILNEREGGTERLEEAMAAYRLALEEFRHDKLPLEWARVQLRMSATLLTLSQRTGRRATLLEGWNALNNTMPVAREGNHQPMIDFANALAQNARAIAGQKGWTLPDKRSSGGLSGTEP